MSAAAAVIEFPSLNPDGFIALRRGDIRRFKTPSQVAVAGALRYRSQKFGRSFYWTYSGIEQAIEGMYCRKTIATALGELAEAKFIAKRSDGRGLWISLSEETVTPQKCNPVTSAIKGPRAAAAEAVQHPESIREAKATPRSTPPQPETGKPKPEAENPIEAAKKIGLWKPERFKQSALAQALARLTKRVVRNNAAGYLYTLLKAIPDSLRPEAPDGLCNELADAFKQARQADREAATRDVFGRVTNEDEYLKSMREYERRGGFSGGLR